MDGRYSYSPDILFPVFVAVFLLALSLYSWRHRSVPGAIALAAGSLFAAFWLLGMALEIAADTIGTKILWHKLQAVVQMPTVTATACFVLAYVQPGRWLNRRNLILISIPSLLVLLFVVVDQSQLMWRRLLIEPDGTIVPVYTILGAALVAVGIGFILINYIALLWLFVRSPQHRWPVLLLVFGGLVARGFYLIDLSRVPLPISVDPLVISFVTVSVAYSIVLFRFHIFDPLAAARHIVIEQMQVGVVVFDTDWRIVSVNPAGNKMLGVSKGDANGMTWKDLAHSKEALPALFSTDAVGEVKACELPEFSLGNGSNVRRYTATISSLQDFRGLQVGHLLMLHDVTQQSHAQGQIVEQQRALATLRERERLARELHDSIGQVLGYASFQADAARKLIANGQVAIAVDQLTRLAAVLQDAHADVREHILNLRTTPSPQRSFFVAVEDYIQGFMNTYGMEARCMIDRDLGEMPLAPESQMQMFRIMQEALSNARKHSKARHLLVSFEDGRGSVRMSIVDDGCGFNVDATSGSNGNHLGLGFMRERVEELGGDLNVEASPGAGTRVTVEVPRRES